MALSNDMAALIGFALESFFYGFYCVLFLGSTTALLWRRKRGRGLNKPMILANFLLFLCCTTHFAIEFNHFYTTLEATGVPDFANETNGLVGADLLISLTDMFGDMVLMYRCWHVWGGNYWVIILPFLSSVAGFACTAEVLSLLQHINPTAPVAPEALVPLGLASYALFLCTNVMITALILGRIWWLSRPVHEYPGWKGSRDSVKRALIVVSESGALYLVTQLIFVVLFAIKHPAQAIMGVVAVQIYGIAPTLIIIGVELGISTDEMTTATTTGIEWRKSTHRPTETFTTDYTRSTAAETDASYGDAMKLPALNRPGSNSGSHAASNEDKVVDF